MSKEGKIELRRFGDAVRLGRKQRGVSQEDFAEICNLHRTYIGQVERGEKNISFINILRLANALKTTPSALLETGGL